MDLHRLIGSLIGAFSVFLLAWNLSTPVNPDHWVNVTEDLVILFAALLSVVQKPAFGAILQVGALFVGAWLTASTGDLPPAGVVGTVAIFLTYVYGGFQGLDEVKVIIVGALQLGGTFFGAMRFGHDPLLSLGHAVVWTAGSIVVVSIGWLAMRKYAEKVLRVSREVHGINKTLMSERKADGTKKT